MSYVTYQTPDKLKEKILQFLKNMTEKGGKTKKGMNETTKSIERQSAKLVVIAENVDPPEIVYHLPLLCDEKKVPYAFVSNKEELGKAIGLQVSCSATAVINVPKNLETDLEKIIKDIEAIRK
ncbi:MAG: 50S ribosomal protein L7Ae [Promethearchaeota archaeon]